MDASAKKPLTNGSWDTEDSLDLYQVPAWGKSYFSINAAGHVVVRPDGTPEQEIDLYEVVEGLRGLGHDVEIVGGFDEVVGHAGAIIRGANGVLEGGADPRSNGAVAAF